MHELNGVPTVTLEWYEASMAARVGFARQMNALTHGRAEADGREDKPGWNDHIEGACGELATAKYLKLYWPGTINTFKIGGDVGPKIQVRTRSVCWYDLKIKATDRDDEVFVLALGRCPVYHLAGWCYAGDAKRYNAAAGAKWVLDPGNRGHPQIFAWQSALRPMAELLADPAPAPGLAPEPPGGYRATARNTGCPVCSPLHATLRAAGAARK